MSKKEKRVTLIRFDQRRIRRLRPLARLVSGLLPWCGPLSLLAQDDAMEAGGIRKVSPLTVPMLMPNGPAAMVSLELRARAGVHS